MRHLLFVLLLLFPVGASAGENPKLSDLSWMAGNWVLERGETVTEELWTDSSGTIMVGLSRSTRDGVTRGFEFLRIEQKGHEIAYLASPGGRAPTAFVLKSLDSNRVVFENPEHDFPQRIIYWRKSDTELCARIEATVEGEEKGSEWCWGKRK